MIWCDMMLYSLPSMFIILIVMTVSQYIFIFLCRRKFRKSGYQFNEDALGEPTEMGVIINQSIPTWSKIKRSSVV